MFAAFGVGSAQADGEEKLPDKQKWEAPFGGFYSAAFTVVSDYTFGGISQSNHQPAFQPNIGYQTPSLIDGTNLWLYLGVWSSNINFASVGPAVETNISGGFKWRTLGNKLSFDLGYVRYTFFGVPAETAYNYGEFNFAATYDFGFASLGGHIHFSPQSFGNSGKFWSERALLSMPLPFLQVNEDVALKVYGSVGNQSAKRFLQYGIPSAGCGNTTNSQGRFILGVTKVF